MAILNQDNVRVQYLISKDTEIGKFNDALYFTAQEFTLLPEPALQAMVDERANAWVASVKEASNPKEEVTEAVVEEVISEEVVAEVTE